MVTQNKNPDIFIFGLEQLSDLEIKKKYLNCWEWTETIISALPQVKEEWQGLRVIRLALEVDLILGATLVKALQEKLQQKAIKLITDLNLNEIVLIELLVETKSNYAVAPLQKILNNLIYCSQTDFYCNYKISRIFTAIAAISLESLATIIVQLLQDKNFYSRDIERNFFAHFNWELLNIPPDDLEPIKKILKQNIDNPYISIRALAFECLVGLKDSWAITELKNDYYREDCVYLEKWNIINIFKNTNDKSFIKSLIYGLFEDDRSCRSEAIEGLKIRDKAETNLVIDILLHGLCQIIEDEEERGILTMQIGEALNEISPDKSLEKLALMVQCGDVNVRGNTVEALGWFSQKKALPIVTKALSDTSNEVIIEALRSLYVYCQRQNVNIEDILPVTTLTNFLKTNNVKIFQLTLSLILHRYNLDVISSNAITNGESIYPILLEKLQDKNKVIKIEAIYNLGYFNNKQVKHKLRQLLEDKDPQIQGYAAYALGNLREQKNILLLIQKLKHPEPIVREGAANGLRLISSALAKQPLIEALQDENTEVQKSVLKALGTIGGKEIEIYLIELIKNSDRFIAIDTAVFVLGIVGGEQTVELLSQMLQKFFSATKREELTRIADPEIIIKALERIETTSAIEALLRILFSHSYLNSFVLDALTNIGGLDIIPRLWEIQLKSKYPYFLSAIASIQKSYQYYNPKYCEITPLNINSDAIQKSRNIWDYQAKYHYSYLSNYSRNN